MNADPRNAPRERARLPHRGLAFALAVAVHLALLAVLIFSIRWQNRAPEPVTAELYAPIAVQPKAAPVPPPPAPKIEPTPTPPPPPPQVQPTPTPPPKPVVEPEKPDVRDAEIALKARKDEERKKRVEAEQREQAEQQKRIAELQRQRELQKQKQLDDKKRADERKAADDKKAADARERQQREMTQMREQVDKEMQQRANAETAARAQAARKSAESDWISRIQAKVKGNVILPPDLSGNPEAIFDVVQLPTGEIIDVKLRKSSGVRTYDDAVQRAILKSSPLPKPDQPGMFERVLQLRFRPSD
jgi:colicin import membrane protein